MTEPAWDVEEILELNGPKLRPDGKMPPTSRLLDRIKKGGILPEVLALAANEIEARPEHHVAAFFQLPFPVKLSETWTRVMKANPDVPAAYFHFQPVKMDFDEHGNSKLRPASANDDQDCGIFTQGVILVPLFGRRAVYHHKFLHHAEFGGRGNPVIVPQRESWVSPGDRVSNVELTFDGYEHNFAFKLLRILKTAIPRFLSAYSIAGLAGVSTPERVLSFCAMIAPGRVSFRGKFYPIAKGLLDQGPTFQNTLVHKSKAVENASKLELREFGEFEHQILALERLLQSGEVALTLVGAMSLSEWLLKHEVRQKGLKPQKNAGFYTLLNMAAPEFLKDEERTFLLAMKNSRNDMAHGVIPERHSYVAGSSKAGREIGGLSSGATIGEVRRLLELIFELYRRHNFGKAAPASATRLSE